MSLLFCSFKGNKRGEFWSDGYFASTVGKHGDEGMIARYVNKQGNDYLKLHRDEQLSLCLILNPSSACGGVVHLDYIFIYFSIV